MDRLLIQAADAEIEPLIVFTKLDKFAEISSTSDLAGFTPAEIYGKIGYFVFEVSNETGQGLEELKTFLTDKISVMAGPSGSGKSSLFNALSAEKKIQTGKISHKSKRGRHTTRHVELMICAGGLLADTPGFSSLFLPPMKRAELAAFFPEFSRYYGLCRFSSCLHDKEPDCAIKKALTIGEISPVRYEHYQIFLQEVIEAERRY